MGLGTLDGCLMTELSVRLTVDRDHGSEALSIDSGRRGEI